MSDGDNPLIIDIEKFLTKSQPALSLENKVGGPGVYSPGCQHSKVFLDDEAHTTTCQECEKVLDPFWYLQFLAQNWLRLSYRDMAVTEKYRVIQEATRNAEAKGRFVTRPKTPAGAEAWDIFVQVGEVAYLYLQGSEWMAAFTTGTRYGLSYARIALARHERYQGPDKNIK